MYHIKDMMVNCMSAWKYPTATESAGRLSVELCGSVQVFCAFELQFQ